MERMFFQSICDLFCACFVPLNCILASLLVDKVCHFCVLFDAGIKHYEITTVKVGMVGCYTNSVLYNIKGLELCIGGNW